MNSQLFTKTYLTSKIDEADLLIIVDTSNYAFRQALAHKMLTVSAGKLAGAPRGHIYGVIQSLSAKLRDWSISENKTACFIFCLDGRPTTKYKLFPGYKQGRGTRDQIGYDPVQEVKPLVGLIPGIYAYEESTEADDIMATIVEQYHNKIDCIVMSTDKDMWTLANKAQVITFKDKVIAQADLYETYGTQEGDEHKIPIVKAIYGDSSDRIPKVQDLPRNAWKSIKGPLDSCNGTLTSFFKLLKSEDQVHSCILSHKAQIETMYKVALLDYKVKVKYIENSGDQASLLKIMELYECLPFLDEAQKRFFGSYT